MTAEAIPDDPPSDPVAVVRQFHEAMQARDWDRAASLLSPSVVVEWPATGERFEGANFLAMQRAYPDTWAITVEEVIAAGSRVASRVRVNDGGATFWCAGFYDVAAGQIAAAIEHWVTAGADEIPRWRVPFSEHHR